MSGGEQLVPDAFQSCRRAGKPPDRVAFAGRLARTADEALEVYRD